MPQSISEEEIVFPLPRILTYVAFTEIPLSAVVVEMSFPSSSFVVSVFIVVTEMSSVMFSVEASVSERYFRRSASSPTS